LENYEESLKAFDKALDKDPNNVRILNNKGEILYHVGMYHDSLLHFDKILQLEPGYEPALANKGSLLLRAGNATEAIIYLDRAIKLNSKNEYALHNKGIALYNTDKYREAIACFDKVIEINANSTMSYFFRGQSYFKLEDYAKALKEFKMISDEDYDDIKHNSIGLCCYQLGLFAEAENAFRRVLERNPSMIDVHYNLAVLYNERRKTKEARVKLETCIKINKNFTKAKEAAQRLEDRLQLDWYGWWFGHGSSKTKRVFGFF
jgi:tetratricopeptide (TPR) repeat protein